MVQSQTVVKEIIRSFLSSSISLPAGIRGRFASGALWSIAGSISNSGFNFVLAIVIARIFGKEVYGEYGMIQSTVLTLSGMAQLATGYTANKYVAEYRSTDKEKSGRIIGLCSVVSAVTACIAFLTLFAGSPWITDNWLKAPHLYSTLLIGTGLAFFSVINGYQMGVLAGLERYQPMTRALVISGSLNFLFCVFGAWSFGLNGAVAAASVSAMVQWLIFRHLLQTECANQGIRIQLKKIDQEKTIFLKFALPAAISGLLSMPATWFASSLLVRQPSGFSQMALYSVALNVRAVVLFLPLVLNKVAMSLLNNQKGLNDGNQYRKIFWANVTVTAGSVLLCALAVAMLGPHLLIIFGKDFHDGYPVLLVVLFTTVIEGISQSFYQIIQSQQRMWLSFWLVALPRDTIIIFFAYLLTPRYGAVGLAMACSAGWLLAFSSIGILAWRIGFLPAGTRER